MVDICKHPPWVSAKSKWLPFEGGRGFVARKAGRACRALQVVVVAKLRISVFSPLLSFEFEDSLDILLIVVVNAREVALVPLQRAVLVPTAGKVEPGPDLDLSRVLR